MTQMLWKELHLRALENKGENDLKYLIDFSTRIPRFTSGCKCREFWVSYIKKFPPKFGANQEYFKWTVDCHNAVNKKLGKPIYSLEEARELYKNELKIKSN